MTELPTYYTNINQTLLEAIPTQAPRVLEIGCGAGPLGGYYRSKVNPDCEYWGVEYVPEAAEQAKNVLSKVITGSIEEEAIYRQLPEDYFDVLIFGDVLEHLREPWDVLKRLAKHMRPGAVCVACIPNILHWSIFRNMLGGNWTYEDSGLMDRTHLRFFSRKSMLDLFNQNGWSVVKELPRYRLTPEKQRIVDDLMSLRKRLDVTDSVEDADFLALQWIMTAKVNKEAVVETQSNSPMKINYCFFVREFFDVRTEIPANALSDLENVDVLKTYREIPLGKLTGHPGAKIVIMQRPKIIDVEKWFSMIAAIRAADCLPVYDVDDHPSLLETIGMRNDNRLLLAKSVPAIQTSTQKLADFYKTLNPHVDVVRNSCQELAGFTPRSSGKPKIFFGAFNRGSYSAEIARKISPVLERYGAAVHVVADKAFFEGLAIEEKTFHEALEYEAYLETIRGCDILLTPLQGLPGEEYKSDVKYIEASSQGVATIASRIAYGETIVDGETGLIADEIDDWPKKLELLLSAPDERERIARNAWEYVRDHRMASRQARQSATWYQALWDQREQLWAEVEQRLPEFKAFWDRRARPAAQPASQKSAPAVAQQKTLTRNLNKPFEYVVGGCPVTLGRFSYHDGRLNILESSDSAVLKIGNFCSIAKNVTFIMGGHHRTDWATTFPFGHVFGKEFGCEKVPGHPMNHGDIIIGSDVWIGRNATIMSGVTIGDGAVIEANANVTQDVPPYSIAAGNPISVVKQRFNDETRDLLLELRWWDLQLDEIRSMVTHLCNAPTTEQLRAWLTQFRGG